MENPPGFCTQDSDCRPTGCSNTVCGNLFGDPEFTICEYKYEYSCYKNKEIASCGCVDYKCQWAFVQPGFDACTEEQSKLNDGVPIV